MAFGSLVDALAAVLIYPGALTLMVLGTVASRLSRRLHHPVSAAGPGWLVAAPAVALAAMAPLPRSPLLGVPGGLGLGSSLVVAALLGVAAVTARTDAAATLRSVLILAAAAMAPLALVLAAGTASWQLAIALPGTALLLIRLLAAASLLLAAVALMPPARTLEASLPAALAVAAVSMVVTGASVGVAAAAVALALLLTLAAIALAGTHRRLRHVAAVAAALAGVVAVVVAILAGG